MSTPVRAMPAALALGLLAACTEPTPPPAPEAPARPAPAPADPAPPSHLPLLRPRTPPSGGRPGFRPTLSLAPLAASTAPGGTVQFKASLNYDPEGPQYIRQPVDFTVEEEGGGRVGPNGLYTAPERPGVYHVVARRQDYPEVRARATVTVQAR